MNFRRRPGHERMSTFLLIPGAGGMSWYWEPVAQRLRDAGHHAIALDLPADDPAAGLAAYTDIAVEAADGHDDLVVAGHSLGAFTAVPLCERIAARHLVMLNAMIPAPGETAQAWWEHTGSDEARRAAARAGGYPEEIDLEHYFFHDMPPEIAAQGSEHNRDEAEIAFAEPCGFTAWPDVPTTVLAGLEDRLFPFAFQQRVARERLATEAQPVPGGHLNAVSRPEAVTRALLATTSYGRAVGESTMPDSRSAVPPAPSRSPSS
jgi:pimeloyl-ACP methyl ester carboxylesterase